MKKYTVEELYKMDAVDVYKIVLKGNTIKKFPKGFWNGLNGEENAIKCIKYLIEEVLKYDDEMIKNNISIKVFEKHKLRGMLDVCFKRSPYKAINKAYPNKFKEWEFKCTSNGYWNKKENGIKATKWLIEEKLKLSDEDIKEQLCCKLFKQNNLGGMLQYCFNASPYEAINSVYPNKFKEWELKYTPNGYWNNKENGIKVTKWLIEEKLKLSDEDIKEQLTTKLFIENGLTGMLAQCFDNSPYKSINSAYPDKFKENDFKGYINHIKI